MRLRSDEVKTLKVLLAASLLLPLAAHAADRRVTVVNASANTMTRLYASPAQGQQVDEDMLGDTILKPGQSAQLSVGDGSDACVYNFKATFDDDTTRVRKVDVCEVRTYRFTGE